MIIHSGNLNGPVELLSFHSMVLSSAVPYCLLLPYLDGMSDGYQQLAALTNYERLTNTLRERKSVSDVYFHFFTPHPSPLHSSSFVSHFPSPVGLRAQALPYIRGSIIMRVHFAFWPLYSLVALCPFRLPFSNLQVPTVPREELHPSHIP